VVVPGARTRDVYLPEGLWVEARDRDGEVYVGRAWLRDVHAPLEKLPCFVRLDAGTETEMDVERAW
jgi:alpha-glucosidase (family GH31 glycosyl hydrolase)